MDTYRKRGILLFMGKWKTLAIGFILLALVTAEVSADMVIFTHEGKGSGTLDGNSFEASDFVITALGDTGDREPYSDGWFIDHLSATISINGVGDFDFLTGTRTFLYNTTPAVGVVGFSRAGIFGADLFVGPNDEVFATWDMLSLIGPISGTGQHLQWTYSPVNTTGGILVFNDGYSYATFTMSAAAVPVPGAVLLGILGLVAVGIKIRKFA